MSKVKEVPESKVKDAVIETDFEGNVPVAKIDAVLSHVVALKYRLPQNREDSLSPSHRPHSREGISFNHFILKYSNIPSREDMK